MSLIVALFPDSATARKLHVVGGEKADNLHMTMAYLFEEFTPTDLSDTVDAVANYARMAMNHEEGMWPLIGETSGFGRFSMSEEDDVLYAGVDISSLPAHMDCLTECLMHKGLAPRRDHGFTPHITLQRLKSGEPVPFQRYPNIDLKFDFVTVAFGSNRYNIPLKSNQGIEVNIGITT